MKGLQIHKCNLSDSLCGILCWKCHVWHDKGCGKIETRQEYSEELRECWNSRGIDMETKHGQVWLDQRTCQKEAGNRSQVELPRQADEITGNSPWGSSHKSLLIMKTDISCLKLLLMSLESGVSVTPLAAVLSGAAQHWTGEATSLKSWVHYSVRKSYNHRKYFIFFSHQSTNFYFVGAYFILKVPNVSKILMCSIEKKEKIIHSLPLC